MKSPPTTVRDSVLRELVAAVDAARLHEEPFAHLHLERAFPVDVYRRMLELLPDPSLYRPDNLSKHSRPDGTSTRDVFGLDETGLARLAADARELWSGVAGALSAPELKQAFFRRLVPARDRRNWTGRSRAADIEVWPRPGLVRDLGGYEILPHPDTRAKVVTVQFYLAPDTSRLDLGTALYRRRLWKLANLRSPRNVLEKVEQLAFEPRAGYAFAVTRRSWHGRETVPLGAGVRNSLLLFYYDDPHRGW